MFFDKAQQYTQDFL